MKFKNISLSKIEIASSATIFATSLFYRLPIISRPFWVDEFSTAIQALLFNQYGLRIFSQTDYYFEYHNITTHALVGIFFKLFGTNEVSARMPFVLLGSIVPVIGYFLAKKIWSRLAGWLTALFLMTSYFQITWSQQARGYMLQQALLLTTLFLYISIIEDKKPIKIVALLLLLLLGFLTHITFVFVIAALLIHVVWYYRKSLSFFKNRWYWAFLVLVGITVLLISGSGFQMFNFVQKVLTNGIVNNVWYYHSFLWREQTLITFLGVIGLGLLLVKKPQINSIFLIVLGFYFFFLLFLFPPYVTRYLLPVFPLLLVGMAVTLVEISNLFFKTDWFKQKKSVLKPLLPLAIGFFIVANGHVFVLKPKPFYSPNHFLREIPLLDYNQVYQPIIEAKSKTDQPVAVIDPWLDRAKWYMGIEYPDLFVFRWSNDPTTTNGLARVTPYQLNLDNQKEMPLTGPKPAILVSELNDIINIREEYQFGFIWMDDVTLPSEVIEYAQENFSPVISLNRYPLDDNPLSEWPGTLYSWGFND